MRGIGVEETAAIGAQHLDRQLRRHGANGNRLLRAFQRLRRDIGAERLRYAEPDVNQCQHYAERQQHIKRGADHIHPEITDRLAGGPRKSADQANGDCHAGCGGNEVLHCKTGHLGQVGHGAFATIVLPVGIRDKADRRVKGQLRPHGRHRLRIIG